MKYKCLIDTNDISSRLVYTLEQSPHSFYYVYINELNVTAVPKDSFIPATEHDIEVSNNLLRDYVITNNIPTDGSVNVYQSYIKDLRIKEREYERMNRNLEILKELQLGIEK